MEFKTTSIEAAYAALNLVRPVIVIPGLPESYASHLQDQLDLEIVIEAVNREDNDGKAWEPDYHNGIHWEPFWFRIKADEANPSGSGFSGTVTYYDRTDTVVGSRLSFKTEQGLKFALKQFEDLYTRVILKLKTS